MTVTDDKLTYNHLGHVTIIATISSDGSFSGSMQTGGIRTRGGINESRRPEQSKDGLRNLLGATRDAVATLAG
jgi:hypothetical protein